jgi:PHD/YefM family antitoxin component YafN of YafNO toxin-antitoxin module
VRRSPDRWKRRLDGCGDGPIRDGRGDGDRGEVTLRTAPQSEPVHFGSHRRDEAVLLSRERYEQQEAAVRELEGFERLGALAMVRARLADDRFSEGTVDDLLAAVDEPA